MRHRLCSRWHVGWVTLAGSALIAACGSSVAPTASPDAGASRTISSPSPDLKATAGQQYQAVLAVYGQSEDAAHLQHVAGEPWSDAVVPTRQILNAEQAFVIAVFPIHFPQQAQSDGRALVNAIQATIQAEEAFSAEPNPTTWDAMQSARTTEANAVDAVRIDLSLAPVPTAM